MANTIRGICCSALVIAIVGALWVYASELSKPPPPMVMRFDAPMWINSGGESLAVIAPWSQGDMFDGAQL